MDRKALRRAYAQLIKRFRPESDPEAFQRIHAAYRQASAALEARGPGTAGPVADPPAAPAIVEPATLSASIVTLEALWADVAAAPERVRASLAQRIEADPGDRDAWLALAAATEATGAAAPPVLARAARSPAGPRVAQWLVELADEAPEAFLRWVDATVVDAAGRTGLGPLLVDELWLLSLAYREPEDVEAVGRALAELAWVKDAQRALLAADAGEAALWRGDADGVERWSRALEIGATGDPRVEQRLDRAAWLFQAASETATIAGSPRLRPVLEVLRTGLDLPASLRSLPWRRFLVALREAGCTMGQVQAELERTAPRVLDLLIMLQPRAPKAAVGQPDERVQGWLRLQDAALVAHPLHFWATPGAAGCLVGLFPVAAAMPNVLALQASVFLLVFLTWLAYLAFLADHRAVLYRRALRPRLVRFMRAHGVDREAVLVALDDTIGLPVIESMARLIATDKELSLDGASLRFGR
ncbi:MAG: hypothetical protein H6704_04365 [Myxococcales bacterium]|nr:hypothetical protein [Myxococcales bacterium]